MNTIGQRSRYRIHDLMIYLVLLTPVATMAQPNMLVDDQIRILGTEPKLFLGLSSGFGYTSIRWKSGVVRWDLFGYPLTVDGEVSLGRPGSGNVLLAFNSERPWRFLQFGTGANTALKLQCNPTNDNKNFIIDTEGTVGINDDNPTYKLELPNNSAIEGGQARAFDWDTYSDARVKRNIVPIKYGLEEILQLRPVAYDHHSTEKRCDSIRLNEEEFSHEIGFLAQDVYEVIPDVVSKPANENIDLWSLSYSKIIPVLTRAIQQQQTEIDLLKRQNRAILEKLTELSKHP